MYCFPMLGEREKLLPETPLICKDYKDSDIDIKRLFWTVVSYFLKNKTILHSDIIDASFFT